MTNNSGAAAAFLLLKQLLATEAEGNGVGASWSPPHSSALTTLGFGNQPAPVPSPSLDTNALLTHLLAAVTAGNTTARLSNAYSAPLAQSFPQRSFEGQQQYLSALLRSGLQPNNDLIQGLLIKMLLSGNQHALEPSLASLGSHTSPLLSQLVQPPGPMEQTMSPAQPLLTSLDPNHAFAEPVSEHPEKKKEPNVQRGTWSEEEHNLFLQGLEEFGAGSWKEIAKMIPSRTSDQTRSHAQKYFKKLAKSKKTQGTKRDREREPQDETSISDEETKVADVSEAAIVSKKMKTEAAPTTTIA